MADFEIERPSVETNQVSPTFSVSIPQFTIEVQGGVQGQRGEKGDKGDPGEPGAPNVLSIGTVVSGDTANASITGTSPNQVLNLVLPQGEPGQDGQDGINGVDGQDGRDGQDGQDGEDGVGIQSVVQTTTSTEDDGNNIVTVTLTDGTTSTFTVQNGSKGSTGAKGEDGAQGPAGADGINGEKGDKGDKGDTGVGVESIEQTTTSHESGGTNIITATLTDGTTSEFYIKNGEAGGGGGGGTSNYNDLTNKPSINNVTLTGNKTTSDLGINIPTKTSDLTNDSGYISGLVTLEYGTSTWQDFQNAYNSNKVVYCKVGGRMAFLAYISASNVEFQYYRSLSSPTVSSQPDEVYVYTLTSANKWTTTTRKASSTIAVGTGLSRSYTASSRTMTLSVDTSTMAQKSDLPTKVSDLTNDSGYITGYTETDPVYSASAASGITSTDITNWNNKSDFSGSYTDLTDKPTIPTVNNATLTIQKNGTTVKTFTANASSNVTANITVPTQTSDLTNNSGYITKSVSDLTNYTPTNSLATVATSGSYNDLSNTPTIPTVPTNISAFTNDSGYITGITSSDIYNVLGYYPAAEPSIYTYSSIRQITSISDGTYISLMDDITNDRPIAISLGATEYVNVLGTNNGNTTSLWYITSDNTYTKIILTVSGTSVTVTTENIEIPTATSDLINDSNFAVTNADNKFSVGQTIAGETVVDSIRTKNMFDKNSRVVYTSGSTYTILENGIRAINTSASENNNNIRFITIDLNNFLGKTLTLTANAKSSSSNPAHMYMCLSKKDGDIGSNPRQSSGTTLDGTLSVSYTIPSSVGDYHYLLIAFYSTRETIASVNSYVDYTNIQLEVGTATTYAPYQNLNPDTSGLDNGHFEENNGYGGFVKKTVRGNQTTYTFSVPNHQNTGFIRNALVMCGDKGFMAIKWSGNNGINPTVSWSSFTSSQVSLSHSNGILTITFNSTVYGSVDVLFTN